MPTLNLSLDDVEIVREGDPLPLEMEEDIRFSRALNKTRNALNQLYNMAINDGSVDFLDVAEAVVIFEETLGIYTIKDNSQG